MKGRRCAPQCRAAGLALLVGVVACAPQAPLRRPDIVLITLDTTRADHLGAYGAAPGRTPNLDRLAARGSVFEQARAQASVTPVSHASIFTGQNPYTHGLRVLHGLRDNRLPAAARTLAEVLRDAGYRTAAFTSAFPVTRRFGLDQGFEHFDEAFLDETSGHVESDGTVDTGGSQRRSDATTGRALAWLARERDGDAPLFVWVHYFDPHDVIVEPPQEFIDRAGPLPTAERPLLRALYAIEVSYMDMQIGRLLEAFDPDESIVAVISDHGEGLGDHDWWTHGLLYEEQIHVPLIVAGAGVAAGGRRVRDPVSSIDVAPTLLELAGIDAANWPAFEGRSLVAGLHGRPLGPAPASYADSLSRLDYHFTRRIVDRKRDRLVSLVEPGADGVWKYIHHVEAPGRSELYELTADPDEARNVFASHRERVQRMRGELRRRTRAAKEAAAQAPAEPMSEDDARRLRALGYGR